MVNWTLVKRSIKYSAGAFAAATAYCGYTYRPRASFDRDYHATWNSTRDDPPGPISKFFYNRAGDFVVIVISSVFYVLLRMGNTIEILDREKIDRYIAQDRPDGRPLVTVANHISTMDDPGLTSVWIPPSVRLSFQKLRWGVCSEEICFGNGPVGTVCSLGKALPIQRGGSIHQRALASLQRKLNQGEWVHVFPEGRIWQEGGSPLRDELGRWCSVGGRCGDPFEKLGPMKWGVGKLIANSEKIPLVVPYYHMGANDIMQQDENNQIMPGMPKLFSNALVTIKFGDPIEVSDLIAEYHAAADERVKAREALRRAREKMLTAKENAGKYGESLFSLSNSVVPGRLGTFMRSVGLTLRSWLHPSSSMSSSEAANILSNRSHQRYVSSSTVVSTGSGTEGRALVTVNLLHPGEQQEGESPPPAEKEPVNTMEFYADHTGRSAHIAEDMVRQRELRAPVIHVHKRTDDPVVTPTLTEELTNLGYETPVGAKKFAQDLYAVAMKMASSSPSTSSSSASGSAAEASQENKEIKENKPGFWNRSSEAPILSPNVSNEDLQRLKHDFLALQASAERDLRHTLRAVTAQVESQKEAMDQQTAVLMSLVTSLARDGEQSARELLDEIDEGARRLLSTKEPPTTTKLEGPVPPSKSFFWDQLRNGLKGPKSTLSDALVVDSKLRDSGSNHAASISFSHPASQKVSLQEFSEFFEKGFRKAQQLKEQKQATSENILHDIMPNHLTFSPTAPEDAVVPSDKSSAYIVVKNGPRKRASNPDVSAINGDSVQLMDSTNPNTLVNVPVSSITPLKTSEAALNGALDPTPVVEVVPSRVLTTGTIVPQYVEAPLRIKPADHDLLTPDEAIMEEEIRLQLYADITERIRLGLKDVGREVMQHRRDRGWVERRPQS